MKRSILSVALSLLFVGGFPTGVSADEFVSVPQSKVAYYADHTIHDGWRDFPVGNAAKRWNRNGRIILTKVPDCAGYNPCVVINEYHPNAVFNSAGVAGWTDPDDKVIGLFLLPGYGYKFRWTVVCHELGHYLGVGHSWHGCMTAIIAPPYIQDWVGDYNREQVKYPEARWFGW